MRQQRLVAPFARGARRYATTDTSRVPAWKKMMNRVLGKEVEEAEKESVLRAELETKRAQEDQRKQLDIKGQTFEIAPLPVIYAGGYVQAKDLDSLTVRIGSDAWVQKIRDEGTAYRGFAPPDQWELSAAQWADVLRHTMVEACVLIKHGRPLDDLCNIRADDAHTWAYTRAATVAASGNKVEMHFAEPEHEQAILASITSNPYPKHSAKISPTIPTTTDTPEGTNPNAWSIPTELAAQAVQETFSSLNEYRAAVKEIVLAGPPANKRTFEWLHIPIHDLQLRLAIFRRVTQLTSRRINNTISGKATVTTNAESLASLITMLAERPRPKKLYETKQVTELKTSLPNVTVHQSRRTKIHREQDVGRWKLIEKELQRRDLPITGTKWTAAKKMNLV